MHRRTTEKAPLNKQTTINLLSLCTARHCLSMPWTYRQKDMAAKQPIHGILPLSLRFPFTHVIDLPSRRLLHSVGTNHLVVPTSRLSIVGSRAFPVAGPQTWNDLPEDMTSAESLTTFSRLLKTHLSRKSFPDYLLDIN